MAINVAGQVLVQNTASESLMRLATGKITFDATAITAADFVRVTCGFKPKRIHVENVTSRISLDWWEGMAANTSIKTAAVGTKTIETTNGGVTQEDGGFLISQNATLAAILASQVLQWHAMG